MQIDTQSAGMKTFQQMRRAQDQNVQNVFSEVLDRAGRQGFASAQITETEMPLSVRIQESWDSWYHTEMLGRYAGMEAPQEIGASFGELLSKAYDQGAYVQPKSFLSELTPGELQTIQKAQGLADPIHVEALSEEGALNLLLPPAAQVDLNRDGLTQSGLAYGIRFPDSTTPADVAKAWEQATDGMPPGDLMVYELQMKMPVLLANIDVDAEGKFLRARAPGDPGFVNPMNAQDYSFLKVTQNWIDHLDYFKNQIDPLQYAKDSAFWHTFQTNLRQNDVA